MGVWGGSSLVGVYWRLREEGIFAVAWGRVGGRAWWYGGG